jgi:hypothetical protein
LLVAGGAPCVAGDPEGFSAAPGQFDSDITAGRYPRATQTLNIDGGGSRSLVCGGRLRNRPREAHGIELPAGRPVTTALVFSPR